MLRLARSNSRQALLALTMLMAVALVSGCAEKDYVKIPPKPLPYVDQGYRPNLPDYLHDTIYQRTETAAIEPWPMTGYSLVVNLQDTGDNSNIPTSVRQAIIKSMTLSGFGEANYPPYQQMEPERVLRDKRVAVVQVVGLLPVGARTGQRFDIIVRAMPNSHTTSLSHGHLYNTELREHGLELPAGGGMVYAYADAGDVFVNPVYSLEGLSQDYPNVTNGQVLASLRTGVVLNGGRVAIDRPIQLALRVPQASIARAIESRINMRLPLEEGDRPSAAAQDQGLVDLYVPLSFRGDWQHFVGLVTHLYMDNSPDTLARRARLLVDEAHKLDAHLTDISFCLEGLGPSFIPYYQSMIDDSDPAVAFCAARAAASCGDQQGLDALARMATDPANPMQLASVHAMGELPPSPSVDKKLESALGSDKDLVRIEAYKILADHGDPRIMVEETPSGFELDIVDYPGQPLIYASRTGSARIAVFGRTLQLTPPFVFSAMHDRFMISTNDTSGVLTLFYRDPSQSAPVKVESGADLAEVIGRLGGKGREDQTNLSFGYPDVVAIVHALSGANLLNGRDVNGKLTAAPMMLDNGEPEAPVLAAASLEVRPETDPRANASRAAGADLPETPSPAYGTSAVPSFSSPGSNPPAEGSSLPTFEKP